MQAVDELGLERGHPARIAFESGPEFLSVTLEPIDPSKLIRNAVMESCNDRTPRARRS